MCIVRLLKVMILMFNYVLKKILIIIIIFNFLWLPLKWAGLWLYL